MSATINVCFTVQIQKYLTYVRLPRLALTHSNSSPSLPPSPATTIPMSATAAVASSQDHKPRTTGASNANEVEGVTSHPHYQTQQIPISHAEQDINRFSDRHFVNVVDGVPRSGGVPAWYNGVETRQAFLLDFQPESSREAGSSYEPVSNYLSSLPSFDYEWSDVGSSSSVGSPSWLPQMPLQSPSRGREYGEDDGMELDSDIGDSVSRRGGSPSRPPSVYSFHSSGELNSGRVRPDSCTNVILINS